MPAPNKPEHIWDRIEKVTESGCWIWTGEITSDGYGRFRLRQKYISVHRFVYEFLKGPIPVDLVPDHLCRVRCCCNPDHIELVTGRENTLRGETIAGGFAKRTHCNKGHEFTPENTIMRGDWPSARRCRTCFKKIMANQYLKRKAQLTLKGEHHA